MKAIYRTDGWVLALCTKCGRANYVEPHGMTAFCPCSVEWTEHESIPQSARMTTFRGEDFYIGKKGVQ